MICKSISAYVALTAGVMASVNAAAIAPRDDRNPSHLLMWDHADTPAVPYNKMHQCTADTIGLRACSHYGNGVFTCVKGEGDAAEPVWVLDTSEETGCADHCCKPAEKGKDLKCTNARSSLNGGYYCQMLLQPSMLATD